MSDNLLEKLRVELEGVLDKEVKVTQIFGEYLSLSSEGVVLLKSRENELYFNMNCSCGESSCMIGQAVKAGLSTYDEIDLTAAGKGFYCFGSLSIQGKKRLCVDILACNNMRKQVSEDNALVMKGAINRKLAIRLGRIGVFTVKDLELRSVAVAFHDLCDAYPKDTVEKHLFEMEARILNKNVLFMTKDEKMVVKSMSNSELSRRIHKRIENSRSLQTA